MKSIPLRLRITALVAATAALAIFLVVIGGTVGSVDESFANATLESAGVALNETDNALQTHIAELEVRLVEWAARADDESETSEQVEPFNGWDDQPGMSRQVLDQDGQETTIEQRGEVVFGLKSTCQVWPGNLSCDGVALGFGDLVETRAEARSSGATRILLVVGQPVTVGDQEFLILLEQEGGREENTDVSTGVEDIAIIVLPLLVIALGLITWFSLGRALRPVNSIIAQVDRIGAESLDQRVPVPKADDELQHLAKTMNRMLDRLQHSSENQRQFISDASHELRSPITATGATLEVAMTHPEQADWQQVAAVVEEENNRLAALVDDLLLLAQLDEGRTPPLPDVVDLEEICLAEAERPHPVEVAVRVVSPARITGNLATLTRAIRNLVDNAAAHAESLVQIEIDGSGADSVRTATGGAFAVIRVHDDGPGVPPGYEEQIFERFVRVDESRNRDDGGGAGLGLAIARRIAETHNGSLHLDASQTKGASFVLRLPL